MENKAVVTFNNLFEHVTSESAEYCQTTCFVKLIPPQNHPVCVQIITYSIGKDEGKMVSYANDWLYLINRYYPHCFSEFYQNMADEYNTLHQFVHKEDDDKSIHCIESPCIFMTPTFAYGTVHGFTAIYALLKLYLCYFEELKHRCILMYTNALPAINELFLTAIHNIFRSQNMETPQIIHLQNNNVYKMNDIVFLRNHHHIFDVTQKRPTWLLDILSRYIKPDLPNLSRDEIQGAKRVCMMKTSNSQNITNAGMFSSDVIERLCRQYNYQFIEPHRLPTEKHLISIFQQAEECILSAGSCFLKNIFYLNENRIKMVHCIVPPDFHKQFQRFQDKVLCLGNDVKIRFYFVPNHTDDAIDFIFRQPL